MTRPTMNNSFLFTFALFASLGSLSFVGSQEAVAGGGRGKSPSRDTNETYVVIRITDDWKDPKYEYKVIATSAFRDEEKQIKDENDQRLIEWIDEKKNDPQTPRPAKISLTKLKTGYQTQRIAQEYADKLTDELATADGGVRQISRAWAGGSRGNSPGRDTNETYMVIRITDDWKDPKYEYKVIATSALRDEEKRISDENDQRLIEWNDEKKNDPQTPRPTKISLKKLKTGYQIQRIAQEYADKLTGELVDADGSVQQTFRQGQRRW
jgi:hypothetical protein